jgi:hypothetical protein
VLFYPSTTSLIHLSIRLLVLNLLKSNLSVGVQVDLVDVLIPPIIVVLVVVKYGKFAVQVDQGIQGRDWRLVLDGGGWM